jgi:hypothetical protein
MFKVGEKVFDINYGWGIVSEVDYSTYPYEVNFDNGKKGVYDKEACLEGSDNRTLYHHDYTPVEGEAIIGTKIENTAFLSRSNELTKREQFAGQAMGSILNTQYSQWFFTDNGVSEKTCIESVAILSVEVADALIKALNEK